MTDAKFILAPMAGITDLPFRIVCKEHGADLLYSEMVSANGLVHSKAKTLNYVNSHQHDEPLVIQLFGNDPKYFAKAAKILENLPDQKTRKPAPRRPNGIDINFGCPVKKIMKQGSGCALMRKPELAKEIIKSVKGNTSLPVSIKIRAGIGNSNAEKFLETVADTGWEVLIVHGRTYKEGFSGPIDTELIKKVKGDFPSKKVFANGGVFSPENAIEVLNDTEADGVAIARGALGNPWIFQQTKDYIETGLYSPPSLSEIKKTALRHAQLVEKHKGERGMVEFRKHLGWYFKGVPGAKEMRKKLFEVEYFEDIKKLFRAFN